MFLVAAVWASGQGVSDSDSKWAFNGYLKDLVTFNILPDNTLFTDNLVHNRLNLKWYPHSDHTAVFELRTRLFHGDLVDAIPNYAEFIDVNNDFFDLSVNVIDKDKVVLHSMIDRFYWQWNKNDWEVKLGRQRINWGTNLVWNPNDLFNAYSFFDFDYEERPGADALRVQKYTGFASSIEFAAKVADDFEDLVVAGMWKINHSGYDLQFLSGVANEDFTIGMGWAGNIKDSGFKGEMTYFHGLVDDSENAYLLSLTWDYSFESSLYIMWSGLYNSAGVNEPGQQQSLDFISNQRLTAKNLSNYRFSNIFQSTYQVTPLITTGLAFIVFPGDQALFVQPTIGWSIIENLDFNVFGQFFWDDPQGELESTTKLIFTRLKWSF